MRARSRWRRRRRCAARRAVTCRGGVRDRAQCGGAPRPRTSGDQHRLAAVEVDRERGLLLLDRADRRVRSRRRRRVDVAPAQAHSATARATAGAEAACRSCAARACATMRSSSVSTTVSRCGGSSRHAPSTTTRGVSVSSAAAPDTRAVWKVRTSVPVRRIARPGVLRSMSAAAAVSTTSIDSAALGDPQADPQRGSWRGSRVRRRRTGVGSRARGAGRASGPRRAMATRLGTKLPSSSARVANSSTTMTSRAIGAAGGRSSVRAEVGRTDSGEQSFAAVDLAVERGEHSSGELLVEVGDKSDRVRQACAVGERGAALVVDQQERHIRWRMLQRRGRRPGTAAVRTCRPRCCRRRARADRRGRGRRSRRRPRPCRAWCTPTRCRLTIARSGPRRRSVR